MIQKESIIMIHKYKIDECARSVFLIWFFFFFTISIYPCKAITNIDLKPLRVINSKIEEISIELLFKENMEYILQYMYHNNMVVSCSLFITCNTLISCCHNLYSLC